MPLAVLDGKVLGIPAYSHGVNLGNGLDPSNEGECGVVLRPRHFEMAKAAGFDHVRLPVRFSAHAVAQAPYTIDLKFFARVDWALDQAEQQGLRVILDLHHYNERMEQPDAHKARFIGLWQQTSDRYNNRPESVAFELLKQPCKKLNPILTNALCQQVIPLIRAKHPKRLIFVDRRRRHVQGHEYLGWYLGAAGG